MISKFLSLVLVSLTLLLVAFIPSAFADQAEGLTITDTHVQSPFDKVPRFCNPPNVPAGELITSTKTGAWSDPATWSSSEVPGNDAKVQIPAGHTVTYDVNSSTPIECIEVQGTLQFSTTSATSLAIRELMVMPGGTLTIGTEADPITPDNPATITFRDVPLRTGTPGNAGLDPQMYGNGLIVFGTVTMHGEKKEPTFVRLAQEPKAGDTTLTLFEAPTGWQAGDEVFVPDTRYISIGNDSADRLKDPKDPTQRERLVIQSVSGTQVTLQQPLQIDHVCARDADSALTITRLPSGEPLCPHLGNLSRTIMFQSENPSGTRGHALFLHRAEMNVQYARFKDMGRTLAVTLDSSAFDASGNLTKVGTNQIGRYSFHLHHVWGPRNRENTGYQGLVIGNAIDGGLKWLMTIHDTHYFHVAHNVVYDGVGAGIVLEDGSETLNVIERNVSSSFSGGIPTPTVRGGSEGLDGDPFWMAGVNNLFVNNVAADGVNHGIGHWTSDVVQNNNIPLIRGADNRDGSSQERGKEADSRDTTEGFVKFVGNEIYSMRRGLDFGCVARSVLEDTRIWHTPDRGVQLYDCSFDKFWVNNMIIRGHYNEPIYHNLGLFDNTVLKNYFYNLDIQHTTRGYRIEKGKSDMENVTLKTRISGIYDFVKSSASQALRIKNLTAELIGTGRGGYKDYHYNFSGAPAGLTISKRVFLENYNGNGTTLQLFKAEQAPGYAPPAGSTAAICNNDPTLTNQQCWDQSSIAIAGELATCSDTTTYPNILGFACASAQSIVVDPPMFEFKKFGHRGKAIPATNTEVYYRHFSVPDHNVGSVKWQLDGGSVQTDADMDGRIELTNIAPGSHTLVGFLADRNGAEIPNTRQAHAFTNTLPVHNNPPTITTESDTFSVKIGQLLTIPITATDPDGDEVTISILELSTLLPGATLE